MRKGIILAGGSGTRLYPLTAVISKQLLPVYDKPMIYYPISTLMLAGIREILLISTPQDIPRFQQLLKDGSQWGLHISYAVQKYPGGIAEAFLIGKDFLGDSACALILGDNIFFGNELSTLLQQASKNPKSTIFAYQVKNPQRYGVVEFNDKKKPLSIIEKPKEPKSRYAVTGLYFYDREVSHLAASLTPSARGELEITDLNNLYLKHDKLDLKIMGRGMAWLDMGTFEALSEASVFIQTIQRRQGVKIGCLEEIAFKMGYTSAEELAQSAHTMKDSDYASYLLDLLNDSV